MTREECETKIAEHMRAIVEIVKEYNHDCKYFSATWMKRRKNSELFMFCNEYFNEETSDYELPIRYRELL